MVNAVNSKGGNAILTIYKGKAHDASSDTYDNTDVFDWLLSHENHNLKSIENIYITILKYMDRKEDIYV